MHTFSKIMAPGLRLGFILTKNTNIIEKLNDSGFMDSGGSVNPIIAYNVSYILNNHMDTYTDYLAWMKKDLTCKMNIICTELDKYPEYFSYEKPDGGYFVFFKQRKFTGNSLNNFVKKQK